MTVKNEQWTIKNYYYTVKNNYNAVEKDRAQVCLTVQRTFLHKAYANSHN